MTFINLPLKRNEIELMLAIIQAGNHPGGSIDPVYHLKNKLVMAKEQLLHSQLEKTIPKPEVKKPPLKKPDPLKEARTMPAGDLK